MHGHSPILLPPSHSVSYIHHAAKKVDYALPQLMHAPRIHKWQLHACPVSAKVIPSTTSHLPCEVVYLLYSHLHQMSICGP